jgi:3,4-dihydroxy 2-butanone 4-phosphate synthase/GTP cyclohydrolase II
MVIVTDDAGRENEGDLIILGSAATAANIGFMVRHTSGVICAAMSATRARRLQLPMMVKRNQDNKKTAYTVSVDAKTGVSTGISASDRAHTSRLLASNDSVAGDFNRPGHIFPLIAVDGGLKERGGHTEAAVTLSQLAAGEDVGIIAELVLDNGEMMRGDEIEAFGKEHNIPVLTIEELITYCDQINFTLPTSTFQDDLEWAQLPREGGEWKIATHLGRSGGEHAILKFGNPESEEKPLLRIHSECLTGDALGSLRCDCGPQLNRSAELIEESGAGYIIYLHDHEGRGIGLAEKILAYQLQDEGMDTVDANLAIGHQVDERSWDDAKDIISRLGVNSSRLITNNPDKAKILESVGVSYEIISLNIPANQFNMKYLKTKRDRLSHSLSHLEA